MTETNIPNDELKSLWEMGIGRPEDSSDMIWRELEDIGFDGPECHGDSVASGVIHILFEHNSSTKKFKLK